MLFFTLLPLLVSSAVARTFVDDRGVTHEINGKPTIVAFTHTAVAMSHFGTSIRCDRPNKARSPLFPRHSFTLIHAQQDLDWTSSWVSMVNTPPTAPTSISIK